MVNPELLHNYLKLHLADGIGSVTFNNLLKAFGSVPEILQAGPALWARVDGVGPKRVSGLIRITDADVDKELQLADKFGVKVLCLEDSDYPAPLKNIYDPPVVLYMRGRLEKNDAVSLGIVGARRCTYYGMEQAGRFGQLLAQAGFTVISGGARGIDTAAHRGAVAVGGRTIVVAGCGLSMHYPSENAELFENIIAENKGAVVSEVPMQTAVQSRNFPKRNRIISGLSLGVLVVEAALRSGSLITAKQAAEQGRDVFAIPGNVDSATSMGTNKLIQDGAKLVQNLDDILNSLGDVGQVMTDDEKENDFTLLDSVLDESEKRIVTLLKERGPMNIDEIIRESGIAINVVIEKMTMLGVKSIITQQPGQVYMLKKKNKDGSLKS